MKTKRGKIVAGNWKMNKNFDEAEELMYDISDGLDQNPVENVTVVVCPPFPYLEMIYDIVRGSGIYTGGQNISHMASGAYTGEISAPMLRSVGAEFVIVGHSERREYFGEGDILIGQKVVMALQNDLVPIYCCGEKLDERNSGKHFDVVRNQVETALFGLDANDFSRVVIAYEPIWAIGTGVTATPGQAQEMHAFIREIFGRRYGKKVAGEMIILYGGSCNAANARSLFANPDVDGGLIGGASLKPEEFLSIIRSF